MVTIQKRGLAHGAKHMFITVSLFVSMVAFSHCHKGCKPPMTAAELEELYRAEQVACATSAKTLLESKACRAAVDARWGITDSGVNGHD